MVDDFLDSAAATITFQPPLNEGHWMLASTPRLAASCAKEEDPEPMDDNENGGPKWQPPVSVYSMLSAGLAERPDYNGVRHNHHTVACHLAARVLTRYTPLPSTGSIERLGMWLHDHVYKCRRKSEPTAWVWEYAFLMWALQEVGLHTMLNGATPEGVRLMASLGNITGHYPLTEWKNGHARPLPAGRALIGMKSKDGRPRWMDGCPTLGEVLIGELDAFAAALDMEHWKQYQATNDPHNAGSDDDVNMEGSTPPTWQDAGMSDTQQDTEQEAELISEESPLATDIRPTATTCKGKPPFAPSTTGSGKRPLSPNTRPDNGEPGKRHAPAYVPASKP